MRLTLAMAVVVLGLVGCSGESSNGQNSDHGRPATSGGSGITSTFCSTFGDHAVEITGVGVGLDPADQEQAFTDVAPVLDELDAQAPPEIAASVQAVTAYLRTYAGILRKYGWDLDLALAEASDAEQSTMQGGGPISDYDAMIAYLRRACPDVTIPE